ncbi:MAG TPA: O-acetyl-ADP-ribose deacetylase [Rhodothermales bacterium]
MEIGSARISLVRGDITQQQVDAIVNAANSGLLGGGGVDGAIHRAAGPSLLEECRRLRATTLPDGLPTGDAVATGAGNLSARHVIHTVGPVWSPGGNDAARLLASAYTRSLDEARRVGARTVAFPSISTGAYRYPIADAARVATRTIAEYLETHGSSFDEIRFVLFSDEALAAFRTALDEVHSQDASASERAGTDAPRG